MIEAADAHAAQRRGAAPGVSAWVSASVSTLVLPVPAEAETHAEAPGTAARRCAACAFTVPIIPHPLSR